MKVNFIDHSHAQCEICRIFLSLFFAKPLKLTLLVLNVDTEYSVFTNFFSDIHLWKESRESNVYSKE